MKMKHTVGADPAIDAAILLDGLRGLPPSGRAAAQGRLVEELRASADRSRAALAKTEAVLAAVLDAITDKGAAAG
jgi:hypothetical protein